MFFLSSSKGMSWW